MSEWQRVETYPMDGTEVLVSMTHSLGHGEWETMYWVDWANDAYEWPIYRERIDIPFPPTHWMPIPRRDRAKALGEQTTKTDGESA